MSLSSAIVQDGARWIVRVEAPHGVQLFSCETEEVARRFEALFHAREPSRPQHLQRRAHARWRSLLHAASNHLI